MYTNGEVTTKGIGVGGETSKQYSRFVYLITLKNSDELLKLAEASSGCVRVYAYMGLLYKGYSQLKEIKNKLLKDQTQLNTRTGCMRETTMVNLLIKGIKN